MSVETLTEKLTIEESRNKEIITKLENVEDEKANLLKDLLESDIIIQDLRMQIQQLIDSQKKEETDVVSDEDDSDSGDAIVTDDEDAKSDEKEESLSESAKPMEISVPKKKKEINPFFLNERRRKLIEIITMMRYTFRKFFGEELANRWGFYVDRHMSKKIFDFLEWVPYPKGNHVLKEHSDAIFAAVISYDGYYMYTGSHKGTIIAWNLVDFSKIGESNAHSEGINSMAFKGNLLVSGGGKMIRLWIARKLQPIRTLKGHRKEVLKVLFTKKGDRIISSSHDKVIRMWLTRSGNCIKIFPGHFGGIPAIVFTDTLLVSGSFDKTMKFWDLSMDYSITSKTEAIPDTVHHLAVNCDFSWLCCVFEGGIYVYKWPEMRLDLLIEIYSSVCTFHPVKKNLLFLVNHDNHVIQLWNICTGVMLRVFEAHYFDIYDICFSPDGYIMFSVSIDQTIRTYDLSSVLSL